MRGYILRKLTVFILGICTLFSASLCFAELPRVGITGFSTSYYKNENGLGQQLCDTAYSVLLKGLSERQIFKLVERAQLETIVNEQGLNLTGLIDDATAASWGKLVGAQYMLICNIDYADVSNNSVILYQTQKAKVKVSARLVDVETGVQKKVFRGEDTKSSNPLTGGSSTYIYMLKDGMAMKEVNPDLLAGATEGAVEKLLKDIAQKYPLAGNIIEIRGERCFIDLGSSNGVMEGDCFDVVEEGKALRDIKTGEVLDIDVTQIGKIKIVEVRDRVAVGKMDEDKRPFRKGDIVQKTVKD